MSSQLLPLSGVTVTITRPTHNASRLVRRVQALGGNALRLPGLSLRARTPDPCGADAAREACAGADDLIFISPAAVDFALRAMPGLQLGSGQLAWTVGGGTTRALATHGIHGFAPQTSQDSEGLLAMPALQDVRGRRMVIIGAPGGRSLLQPELERRGARVCRLHVYTRVPPRLTRRHAQAISTARAPLITLLSSGEALDNIMGLLPPAAGDHLRRACIVVASARLAAQARRHGFLHRAVAASALEDDMLAAAIRMVTQCHVATPPAMPTCASMLP